MHESSMRRMEWFIKTFLDEKKCYRVLDVGSYNVNGSYKELFKEKRFSYVGLDMEEGPNVDIVPESTYEWKEIENETYDIVISGQAFEHIEFFWLTMAEIVRVTKKNGIICIIAPNGFEEHRYPVDCWRFHTDGMIALARYCKLELIHAHTNAAPDTSYKKWYSENESDSIVVARKPYEGTTQLIDRTTYRCTPENHENARGGMKTYEEYQLKEEMENLENKNIRNNESGRSSGFIGIVRRLAKKAKGVMRRIIE